MNRAFRRSAPALLVMVGILTAVVLWLVAAPPRVEAAAPAAPAAPAAKPDDSGETELTKQMKLMEDGMKKLRRTLRQPEANAESLKTITAVQQAAVATKEMVPQLAAKKPEAERAKFVAAYRKDMAIAIIEMLKMEIAVLEGKNDVAQEIHKNLKTIEEKGHKDFTELE